MNKKRLDEIRAMAEKTPTLSYFCTVSDIQLISYLLHNIGDLLAYVEELEKQVGDLEERLIGWWPPQVDDKVNDD